MNELILDLDSGSIGGFAIGSSEESSQNKGSLNNPTEGYSINLHEGTVSSLFVCYLSGYNGFQCFSGSIKINNDYFNFNSSTTVAEIKSKFGSPTNEWNDGVEKCLEYSTKSFFIEALWSVENGELLQYVSVEYNKGVRA